MATNKIPTLVIGLGGVGCRITAGLNNLLSDEDKKYVGTVGIDTNANDLTIVGNQGLQTIRISDNRKVQDYLREFPEFCEWFPVHRLLNQRGLTAGAGQIRTISRLAALVAEKRGDFRPIEEEIKRITQSRIDGTKQTLAVVITGSITGGTGAGMFLQMPYYIRNLLKNSQGIQNVVIRGMFMGADITRNVQTSTINRKAVGVNAYACIKELNALYLSQMHPETTENIKLDFFDEVDREEYDLDWDVRDEQSTEDKRVLSQRDAIVPYDYLYLIEGNNNTSSLGNASISSIESLMSRTLFTLLFTPVVNDSLSIEDNFTIQQVIRNGMSRYASSGICRLIYPVDLAKEYVVLSTVKELVSKEWRLVDQRCEEAVILAQSMKKNDGHTEIPTEAENFCTNFKKAVCDTNAPLAMLYSETYIKDETTKTDICVAERFFNEISSLIDQICNSDEVNSSLNKCKLNSEKMKNLENAASAISELEEALKNFERLAKNTVKDNYAKVINEIFPPSVVSMEDSMQTGTGIYSWITSLHPVTARYFCNKLILLLESKVTDCQKELSELSLRVFEDADYDVIEKGDQTPSAALNLIKDKVNVFNKYFYSDERRTKKLTSMLISNAEKQTKNIKTWMEGNLYQTVCEEVLRRVKALGENYKLFFDSINSVIKNNEERIRNLETLEFPIGEEGIYCSSKAFKKMASEYGAKNEFVLPDEAKKKIFMDVFRVTAEALAVNDNEPEHDRVFREKAGRTVLKSVFETTVLNILRARVTKHGDSIINLTARQALAKEYELKTGNTEAYMDPELYKAETTAYAKERVTGAMNMAAPLIAVRSSALTDVAELVFLAINPETAEKEAGKPSVGKTQETYFPKASDVTGNNQAHILMNDEFASNEIVCVRTQYLFDVEDLVKYNQDSVSAKDYFERINNIGGMIINPTNSDAFKTVINPHLNRNWHQEGFVPALTLPERKRSKKETLRAFVYAVGLDCVTLEESDETNEQKVVKIWMDHTLCPPREIMRCGNRIGGRYIDFFNSIDFNRNMKRRILALSESYKKEKKGFLVAEEVAEEILNIDFIYDLIQPLDNRKNDDTNVYDVFLEMREYMSQEDFTNLVKGLLDTLWDFTSFLLDKNRKLVNKTTARILEAIYNNCSIADKVELSFGEKRLKELHEEMLSETYYG